MALTLDNTYGGSNANTYLLVADANALMDEFMDSQAWSNASDTERATALVHATRNINAISWHGAKYFFTQILEFPRVPADTTWSYLITSRAEPDATFANFLEQDEYLRKQKYRVYRACAVQANYLLKLKGHHIEREQQYAGNVAISVGAAGVSESRTFTSSLILHPDALDFLRFYKATARLVRGDSGSSVPY